MWKKKFSNIKDALAYYNNSIDLRILVRIILRWERVSNSFLNEILVKDKMFYSCPFHDDKKPSFAVGKKYFKCFGCTIKGDYVVFIEKILEKRGIKAGVKKGEKFVKVLDFLDLVISLDDKFLLRGEKVLPSGNDDCELIEHSNLFRVYSDCYAYYIRNFHVGDTISKFLRKRGFDSEFLYKFGIGYCPRMHDIAKIRECSDRFLELSCRFNLRNSHRMDSMFERLIFPVHDLSDNILGFIGRDCRLHVNDVAFVTPKYKCTRAPSFNRSLFYSALLFFNRSAAQIRSEGLDYICITEGPLDCLRLILHGHPAVAILGNYVAEERIKLLSTLPVKRFICCFDNDDAGKKALESFISYARILTGSIQRLEIDDKCKDIDEHLKLFPNRFAVSDILK